MANSIGVEEQRLLGDFIVSAAGIVRELNDAALALEHGGGSPDTIDVLFRGFHTLKGNAAIFGLKGVKDVSHCLEDLLSGVRKRAISVDDAFFRLLWQGLSLVSSGVQALNAGNCEVPERPEKPAVDAFCGAVRARLSAVPAAAPVPASDIRQGDGERFMICKDDVSRSVFIIRDYISRARSRTADAECSEKFIDNIGLLKEAFTRNGAADAAAAAARVIDDHEAIASGDGGVDPAAVPYLEGACESMLSFVTKVVKQFPPQSKEKSLHVEEERIDQLIGGVKRLEALACKLAGLREPVLQSGISMQAKLDMNNAVSGLNALCTDIFQMLVKIKLVSPELFMEKCRRSVESLAVSCGKNVRVEVASATMFVERANIELLDEVFIHIVRNSIDHGIEAPEERARMGKSPEGVIRIEMRDESEHLVVTVRDDGRGIDFAALREAAYSQGKLTAEQYGQGDRLDPMCLLSLSGVSTKKAVTEISGRGIGLNAVHSQVVKAGGTIGVSSQAGRGTCFELRIPSHIPK